MRALNDNQRKTVRLGRVEFSLVSLIAFIAFVVFTSAGCASNQVWNKNGGFTTDELNKDRYACMQESGYSTSGTRVEDYIKVSIMLQSCMYAKGWFLRSMAQDTANAVKFKQFDGKTKAICSKPQYAAYFEKTSCLGTGVTFEQLVDASKIKKKKKAIYLKFLTEADGNTNEMREFMRKNGTDDDRKWVDYLESTQPEIDKYRLELYNATITWGEYNTRRKDMAEKTMSEWKKIHPPQQRGGPQESGLKLVEI